MTTKPSPDVMARLKRLMHRKKIRSPESTTLYDTAQWQPSGTNLFSLILFTVEYKNANQLLMTFATVHRHRQALGLAKKIILGVECTSGLFKIGASWYEEADDMVCL